MIKKAVVAAAGKGTRMLHLTRNKPKHLIRVGRFPFLNYLLCNLLKAGYSELIVVAGYKREIVEDFLKEFPHPVRMVDQFEILGKERYGTACALECAREALGEESFIMVYGDHIFSVGDLKAMNISDRYTYTAGRYHHSPQKFGVLKVEDGFLKKIIEKPKTYVGNFINIGLYKFTPDIWEKLTKIKISERGEYELTDAVNMLAAEKKVKVKEISDFFIDFTNPADVIRVSQFLKNENP